MLTRIATRQVPSLTRGAIIGRGYFASLTTSNQRCMRCTTSFHSASVNASNGRTLHKSARPLSRSEIANRSMPYVTSLLGWSPFHHLPHTTSSVSNDISHRHTSSLPSSSPAAVVSPTLASSNQSADSEKPKVEVIQPVGPKIRWDLGIRGLLSEWKVAMRLDTLFSDAGMTYRFVVCLRLS
jgi:hypothetical protein